MPGPGNKKRKARRGKSINDASPNLSDVDVTVLDASSIKEINDAKGWENVVVVLCRSFDLPNLETRSGLKKIHANFDEIQKKLEATYDKFVGNEKVIGGIVGIWARMCVDAILRDKLFIGGGVLSRMVPLLDLRSTRYITLQALSTVTHHSGAEVRQKIAEHTATLLRLMDEFPDNIPVNELLVGILAHVVSAVFADEKADLQAVVRRLDVPSVLRHILAVTRNPAATSYLLSHSLILFTTATARCQREIKAVPSIINLLIACLRCGELSTRCNAWAALIRLMDPEAEQGYVQFDSQKFMATLQRGIPSHLSDTLMDYNPFQCDIYLIPRCSLDYQQAMGRCVEDRDMYALGSTLATLIVRTEYAVADGAYQALNERTGRLEIMDTGLPFVSWLDAFPLCVDALRQKGAPKDLDMADIVELKFLLLRRRIPDAATVARRAITRNPQIAYFYYVLSLDPDMPSGLKACKKGLKCKQTTPFVRSALLVRAVDHAAQLGISRLSDLTAHASAHEEGVAFLMSAEEDSKAFISETPPDSRHMAKMLDWHMLLTIVLRGKELSADLGDLDDSFRKLDITKEFSKFFGTQQQKTTLRLTRDLVTSKYKKAITEWSSVIARLDGAYVNLNKTQSESAAKAEDNLSAWLEGLHIDGEEDYGKICTNPKINSNMVALYRCSHCGSPSAVLRKCSGCGKTKYCDSTCQKMHWPEHKSTCREARS